MYHLTCTALVRKPFFSTTPEDGKGATTDPWQCTTVLMPHVALRTLPRVAQKAWESGHANKIMIKWTCQKLKVLEESHRKNPKSNAFVTVGNTLSKLISSGLSFHNWVIFHVHQSWLETKGYGV